MDAPDDWPVEGHGKGAGWLTVQDFGRGYSQMHADEAVLNHLSERIIGCAFMVANGLGRGFLEKVYENALALELRSHGMTAGQQHGIAVKYNGVTVGQYTADLLVEEAILVEIKSTKAIDPAHLAQCRHYLKATGLRLCLLINFGPPRVEIKRIVLNL